jgi:ribosome-binding factor A
MKTPEMTQRQKRVAELVRDVVSSGLSRGEVHLPPGGMVTLTGVWVSPDLRTGTVYFSLLGQGDVGEIAEALNAQARHFNQRLGKELHTKYTPRLRFRHDDALEEADRLNALIRKGVGTE